MTTNTMAIDVASAKTPARPAQDAGVDRCKGVVAGIAYGLLFGVPMWLSSANAAAGACLGLAVGVSIALCVYRDEE